MRNGFAVAMILATSVTTGLGASTAKASCGMDTLVFSCGFKSGKDVHVCMKAGTVSYRFGRPDRAPELTLSSPVTAADYLPWNGVGRTIYEEVRFANRDIEYVVWGALDRQITGEDPKDRESGGVTVMRGDQTLADLRCVSGSTRVYFDELSDAKARAGLCWRMNSREWGAC